MKTVLEMLNERFAMVIPYTPEGINQMNEGAAEIVREYCRAGEITHGPAEDCITLGNVPLDALPFLPLADPEISEYGTYRVYQHGAFIGSVLFRGFPVQDRPQIGIAGIETKLIPAQKMTRVELEITCEGKEDTQ